MISFWLIAASGLAVFFANFLWWIFRKNPPTVFFPIAKILNKKPKLKPIFKWKAPNFIHFFSFLFLSALLFWMFFKPQVTRYFSMNKHSDKTLFVGDFSASIQSQLELEDYKTFIANTISSTKAKFSESQFYYLNTSHGGEVRKIDSDEVLQEELSKSFFNPAATLWSRALQRIVLEITSQDFSNIIVISDFQNSSWDGVDIENFEKFFGMKLYVFKVSQEKFLERSRHLSNHFIQSHLLKMDPIRKQRTLDLTLGLWRSNLTKTLDTSDQIYELDVFQGDERIYTHRFLWNQKEPTQKLSVQWPLRVEGRKSTLVRVEVRHTKGDLMVLDNQVVVPIQEFMDKWTLFAPRSGENYMAEPWFHLQNAMESLSFAVDVKDAVVETDLRLDGGDNASSPMGAKWILLGGQHPEDFSFCSPSMQNSSQMILFPSHVQADYRILCKCVAKQLGEEAKANSWCQNVSDAVSFSELLKSVGGKQQAGSLGESSQALAWKFVEPVLDKGKNLLVFTVAPVPAFFGGHVPFLNAIQFFLKSEESVDVKQSVLKLDLDWFSEVLNQQDSLEFFRTTQKISSSESNLDQKNADKLTNQVFVSLDRMLEQMEKDYALSSSQKTLQVESESASIPYPDSKPFVWLFLFGIFSVWCGEIILRYWEAKGSGSK